MFMTFVSWSVQTHYWWCLVSRLHRTLGIASFTTQPQLMPSKRSSETIRCCAQVFIADHVGGSKEPSSDRCGNVFWNFWWFQCIHITQIWHIWWSGVLQGLLTTAGTALTPHAHLSSDSEAQFKWSEKWGWKRKHRKSDFGVVFISFHVLRGGFVCSSIRAVPASGSRMNANTHFRSYARSLFLVVRPPLVASCWM